PKKVARTRKAEESHVRGGGRGEEEAPTEEAVGGTQESEAVASKSKPKPKAKPKKKVVVSPAVGENVLDEEEGEDDGEDKAKETEDAGLHVRPRRRLRRVTSAPVPEAKDSEETESDENVQRPAADSDVNKDEQPKKRRQKQLARTGPLAKKAETYKGKIPLVKEDTELVEEPDVDTSGSPTFDVLDKQVDELLAHPFIFEAIPEEGNERDEGAQDQ
ncbi:hypothetical protein Dimus_024186, partial [Dionaea muscipula]